MSFNFNTADYRPSTNPMKGYFKSKQERWMEQVRQEEEVAAFMDANWYGSDKAAFKPEYKGSTIFYGGEVKSVSQVNTAGMQELKFPNGKVYMYK